MTNDVPDGFLADAIDVRGRVLGIAAGRVVRWSPEDGWRVLLTYVETPRIDNE